MRASDRPPELLASFQSHPQGPPRQKPAQTTPLSSRTIQGGRIAQGRQRLIGLLFLRVSRRVGRQGVPDRRREESANSVSSADPSRKGHIHIHTPTPRQKLAPETMPSSSHMHQSTGPNHLPFKECSDQQDYPFHKSNRHTEKKGQICAFQIGRRPCQRIRRWRSKCSVATISIIRDSDPSLSSPQSDYIIKCHLSESVPTFPLSHPSSTFLTWQPPFLNSPCNSPCMLC
ncbi:hypothetical protein EDB86DRAFT_989611 [Lactarius hatsudake]|nr:hypothetical protein EDB86DRAFT_989611 [Lactarius hatsudake]